MVLVGNVSGKTAILVDDMVRVPVSIPISVSAQTRPSQADTCGTLALAADNLEKAGAVSVIALVTHGILSSNATEKISKSKISQLVVTNTLPQEDHVEACDKLKMLDISHVLAETIRRSHYGESVSYLFDAMLWDPIRIDCEPSIRLTRQATDTASVRCSISRRGRSGAPTTSYSNAGCLAPADATGYAQT